MQLSLIDDVPEISFKSVSARIEALKSAGQDMEWYPTDHSMLKTINEFIDKHNLKTESVIDVGAGDGRVLSNIDAKNRYAIEKSSIHIQAMPPEISVIGTAFEEQSLIDKQCDLIFSNPPYSQFEDWVARILKEGFCLYSILIIPIRWRENKKIKQLLEERDIQFEIIDTTDFLDAERKARAKVDIVFFDYCKHIQYRNNRYSNNDSHTSDPFDIWFEDFFEFDKHLKSEQMEAGKVDSWSDKLKNSLVTGSDLIDALVCLYGEELDHLCQMYKKITTLDPSVLKGLDINVKNVSEGLKLKIKNLKTRYWEELFNNFEKILKRLCSKQRERMKKRLMEHVSIDFSRRNAHAIASWLCKNANSYYDQQVVDLVEKMTSKASVVGYKSNLKTFKQDGWRYTQERDNWTHYKLDYRFILEGWYGLHQSVYEFERTRTRGLSESGYDILNDILTVANNVGFPSIHDLNTRYFESNKRQEFFYTDHVTGKTEILFDVRAFKCGNLHLRFAPRFIATLNTEFGRIKGWVKSKEEASTELNIDINDIENYFGANQYIPLEAPTLMICEVA